MPDSHGLVILIHGLWMNGLELTLLRWRLQAAGFRTKRFHYPTTRAGLEDNARRFATFIEQTPERPLYIVAHSLGGVVTLRAFAQAPDLPVERAVFLAAPVRGSSVARAMMQQSWSAKLLGKSGPGVLAATHAPVWMFAPSLGVLTGTQSVGAGQIMTHFDGPNDGTVAVAETTIDGAADRITVNAGHMSMLASRTVADQVIHFLRYGWFTRS
ncbi:MAG TPA: alpha/beta fold hydrolase [Gammaproteobacteria bacterium]|nr:alpha/beta fold hydrolase [Gammaproteobacteria bacterium]